MRTIQRRCQRGVAIATLLSLLVAPVAWAAGPSPAPPYPPYPTPPAPRYYPPPPPVVEAPPPLSPVTRAIYAPFYVAGLIIRYGVYYLIVAPIEVLTRTIVYGEEGGVQPAPPPQRPAPSPRPPSEGDS
jgi:hypothetical protein